MKKRLFALLLCAALLTPLCADADAGGQDDPLISLSYVDSTFLPQAKAAISAAAREALEARADEETAAARLAALAPGEGVLLSAGQRLVVASGDLKLYTDSGEAVNATAGVIAENGTVPAGTRVIVCEDGVLYADAVTDTLLKVSSSASATEDGCPFRDVGRAGWYHGDVAGAYRRGLVNGVTPERYEPAGNLTAAQCVKLAACMRQLWQDGAVTLENSPEGTPWYRSYVDFALEAGILEQEFADYNAIIVRQRFVELFWRALPGSAYAPVNNIPDGAIPDVDMGDASATEIYDLYRAGILTGYASDGAHAAHAFDADSLVTRAEVATIMNRMFDEDARVRFEIKQEA